MRFPFTQQLPNAVDAGVRAPEAGGPTGGRVQFNLATLMGVGASELNPTSGGGMVFGWHNGCSPALHAASDRSTADGSGRGDPRRLRRGIAPRGDAIRLSATSCGTRLR